MNSQSFFKLRGISFVAFRESLLSLGILCVIAVWLFLRVQNINPAILADEYLYSMNSRKAAPWDPSPAGDFSNYLFNFVYQATNLCGSQFYSCAKSLNIVFFLGFIATLFTVARRFLPFWAAIAFMIVSAASPLSIYTSMFLPESMYLFFMGLALVAVLRAMNVSTWRNWALVGAVLGVASLVKPHAWISAIPIVIVLLIVGLGDWQRPKTLALKSTFLAVLSFAIGAFLGRVILGTLIAGPKAFGFFGRYFGIGTIEQITSTIAGTSENTPESGNTAVSAVISLFPSQFSTHLLVISAFLAISLAAILSSILDIFKTRRLTALNAFGLFSFVWLFSLMISIVIFTGWVTGSGDDHTTRVLLRYYEFLFLIVPLAGVSILAKAKAETTGAVARWVMSGMILLLITPAFTGAFSTLTIQIADAPTLAGLVVNAEVFNWVAIASFASLILFASFPRYSVFAYIVLLPLTMVATGFQTQEQYHLFRGEKNAQDLAGFYLRENLADADMSNLYIIAATRFEATNVAFWADSLDLKYDMVQPNSLITPDNIPLDRKFVLVTGSFTFSRDFNVVHQGQSFALLEKK